MIINYTTKELELLARLMRAEALGEGNLGMLMVGNVVVNRALADCLTFKNIRTITEAIYQKNQFTGTQSSLFNGVPTTLEKSGTIKNLLEDTKVIVFIFPILEFVKNYIKKLVVIMTANFLIFRN